MMKLIDKDALIAEIERKADIICQGVLSEEATMSVEYFKDSLISFLDTLEVKEVDLEKEYKDFVEEDPVYNKLVNSIVGKAIAKHFFELSLKVQKGEEV